MSRTFNPITYTDCLAVFEFLLVGFADAVVVVVG